MKYYLLIFLKQAVCALCAFLFSSIYLAGCSDNVTLSSSQQLAQFENAGPIGPTLDMGRIVRARMTTGSYRVVPDDVLELTMPAILQIVTAEEPRVGDKSVAYVPFVCRVNQAGTITLPAIGEIAAGGKRLAEIESAVISAYYPQYAKTRPSVFCRVLEYKTAKVSISGAVQKPGIYALRSDQMSLVALLMEAGGIGTSINSSTGLPQEGAAAIRIVSPDDETTPQKEKLPKGTVKQAPIPVGHEGSSKKITDTSQKVLRTSERDSIKSLGIVKTPEGGEQESVILPVKGLNVPFADVALKEGDSVIVERLQIPLFSVIGLVERPGNFPYPPDMQYNLMQALGLAGGLDKIAEPRYATVYRLTADGKITSGVFQIAEASATEIAKTMNLHLKPGDIIDVASTPRTRTNVFLRNRFSLNFGAYVPLSNGTF